MYNDHSSISLPPMICWIFLWNYGGYKHPPSLLKVSYEGKNYRTVRVTYIGEYLYIIRLRDLAGSVISQG